MWTCSTYWSLHLPVTITSGVFTLCLFFFLLFLEFQFYSILILFLCLLASRVLMDAYRSGNRQSFNVGAARCFSDQNETTVCYFIWDLFAPYFKYIYSATSLSETWTWLCKLAEPIYADLLRYQLFIMTLLLNLLKSLLPNLWLLYPLLPGKVVAMRRRCWFCFLTEWVAFLLSIHEG